MRIASTGGLRTLRSTPATNRGPSAGGSADLAAYLVRMEEVQPTVLVISTSLPSPLAKRPAVEGLKRS